MSRHIDVLNEEEKKITRRIFILEQRHSFQTIDYKKKITDYEIKIKRLMAEIEQLRRKIEGYTLAENDWLALLQKRKGSYTIFGKIRGLVPQFCPDHRKKELGDEKEEKLIQTSPRTFAPTGEPLATISRLTLSPALTFSHFSNEPDQEEGSNE